jgi:uracil-DNA glycosylase
MLGASAFCAYAAALIAIKNVNATQKHWIIRAMKLLHPESTNNNPKKLSRER